MKKCEVSIRRYANQNSETDLMFNSIGPFALRICKVICFDISLTSFILAVMEAQLAKSFCKITMGIANLSLLVP